VPDNLDHCAEDGERLVRVVGNNFRPGVMVLLNGNAVSIRITDAGSLEFRFPELPAGVYGVEVRNADGTTSLPHSLWVNSIPEIISVERDGDFVNRYDMIIRGKNFFYNSILVVREPQNPAIDSTYRLSTFHAGGSDAAGMLMARPGGSLLYSGCDTLVYRRYPLNMQDKELLLQVINPDGKKTDLYPVTLP